MDKKESTQSASADRGNRWFELEKWIFEEFLRQRSQAEGQTADCQKADDYYALNPETSNIAEVQSRNTLVVSIAQGEMN
jgi:hypothetical protein